MKKRAMKKWIPKGVYCYDAKRGKCKWLHYLGYKEWNKNNCEFAKDCKEKECNCDNGHGGMPQGMEGMY